MKGTKKTVLIMILLMVIVTILVSCDAPSTSEETGVKTSNEAKNEEEKSTESVETKEEAPKKASKPVSLSQGEIDLKEKLVEIARNDFAIDENTDVDSIINEMIKYIGTPNSRLRDDLIYRTFTTWIVSGDLETEQLKKITQELLSDDKLRYKIGEVETDSVFTRSFSVLALHSILYYDQNNSFLTEEELVNIYDRLKNYFNDEKDYRGRVKIKGWAHAIAHSGDTFSVLVKYEAFGQEELKEILELVKSKIVINSYKYNDGEEARLVAVIRNILRRQIVDDSSLEAWVESIINYDKTGDEDEDSITQSNVKDFLGSLYNSTKHMEEAKVMVPIIEEFLQRAD